MILVTDYTDWRGLSSYFSMEIREIRGKVLLSELSSELQFTTKHSGKQYSYKTFIHLAMSEK
jgi:hypothetical protein